MTRIQDNKTLALKLYKNKDKSVFKKEHQYMVKIRGMAGFPELISAIEGA